jgi:hypothetical protein
MINEHQGGVECRSPSTPPRWCLLLLVAPAARGALARQPCRSCARRSFPRGAWSLPSPPLRLRLRSRAPARSLASPCGRPPGIVGMLAHCSAALPRCALARRSSARRRPRPCPDGRALRFAARALCFRSAAARAASRPGWPPARAPPAADACPSASPRRAPPLLGGLRAASRRPRSSLLRAGRGSGGPRARCRSLLYAGAGPAARRWLRRLSVRSLSAVRTSRY